MVLLERAEKKRHIASTNFNEVSSRSHTVFSLTVESSATYMDDTVVTKSGELKLVDLAGNERGTASEGVEGAKDRLAEGQAINKSLFNLSEVISKLSKKLSGAKKDIFIPWRESKLTRLLQSGLGGNSRACVLVALHPSTQAMEITLSTLRFATKSKSIKKKIVANFVSPEQSLIAQQKEQIAVLKEKLLELRRETHGEDADLADLDGDGAITIRAPRTVVMEPEEVKALKDDLSDRLSKLSRLILTQETVPHQQASVSVRRTTRRATVTGTTQPAGLQVLRMGTMSGSSNTRAVGVSYAPELIDAPQQKSLNSCLEYLKQIDDMNKAEEDFADRASQGMQQQAPLRMDTVNVEDAFQNFKPSDKAMRKIRRQFVLYRRNYEDAKAKSVELEYQANFTRALMKKLGLSLLTSSVEGSIDEATQQTQTETDEPNTTPTSAANENENSKFSTTATVGSVALRLTHDLSKRHPFKDKITSSISAVDHRAMHPFAVGLLGRIVGSAITRTVDSRIDAELREEELSELLANRKVLSADNNVSSIMKALKPWEQFVLALMYEQQKMRLEMAELRDTSTTKLHSLSNRITHLITERDVLREECASMVDAVRYFTNNMASQQNQDLNQRFVNLVKRADESAIRRAASLAEAKTATEKLSTIERRLESAEVDLKIHTDRQGMLGVDVLDMPSLPSDLAHVKANADVKPLVVDVLLSRQRLSESKIQGQEMEELCSDMRKVNSELFTELSKTEKKFKRESDYRRLLQLELKNERKLMQAKFEDLQEEFDKQKSETALTNQKCEGLTSEIGRVREESKRREEAAAAASQQESEEASNTLLSIPNKMLSVTPGQLGRRASSVRPVSSSVTAKRRTSIRAPAASSRRASVAAPAVSAPVKVLLDSHRSGADLSTTADTLPFGWETVQSEETPATAGSAVEAKRSPPTDSAVEAKRSPPTDSAVEAKR
eukprot:Lankesteria_metandrocarpae@DN6081_c0_g1_i1.p1